jgi:ABC-type ATPase with predicted acetyltransferase domain
MLPMRFVSPNLVVFDEFTSTVDRIVSQIGSYAISRAVRKHPGKQFIAVTCHFDVLDWLEPDWVYDVDANVFWDYRHIAGAQDVFWNPS